MERQAPPAPQRSANGVLRSGYSPRSAARAAPQDKAMHIDRFTIRPDGRKRAMGRLRLCDGDDRERP
jgi:hypothetical protein